MNIVPVLIDCRPPFLGMSQSAPSLLLAPLGSGSLLTYLRERLSIVDGLDTLRIVTYFAPSDAYRTAILAAEPEARLHTVEDFVDILEPLEPSDWLLILDPRHFPTVGFSFSELLADVANNRFARHIVPLQTDAGGLSERVLLDRERRVRRIQRYYEGVTRLETSGVAASAVSVAAMRLVSDSEFFPPVELRARLSQRGVPGRDITQPAGMYELTEERDFLQLNERLVADCRRQPPTHLRATPSGVLLEDEAYVAPEARVHGAVILRRGAAIERGATVIGPAVLGPNARVCQGAIMTHGVLLPHVAIRAGVALHHRVVTPDICGAEQQGAPAPGMLPHVYDFRGGAALHATPRHRRRRYILVKQLFESLAALLGLFLLAPLLLVVAVLVKLTSPGPILFGHQREGLGGRVFQCWKFRTMVSNAHALQRQLYDASKVDGPQFKIDHDPRVTPLGRILRATNIDELPQLFNVLLGQMSLIGPRPSPFRENQICVPWRNARLSVRPGITGLWQICRHERAAGDFHQWIYYDMLYVRHMSWWLDLKILLATMFTLGGRFHVPLSWMIPPQKLRDFVATPVIPVAAAPLLTYGSSPRTPSATDTTVEAC